MIGNATLLCSSINSFISLFQELQQRKDDPAEHERFCNMFNMDPKERALGVATSVINLSHYIWQLRNESPELEKTLAFNIKNYEYIVYPATILASETISILDDSGKHAEVPYVMPTIDAR